MTTLSLFLSDGSDMAVDEHDFHARLNEARNRMARPFSQERLDLVADVGNAILKRKGHYSPFVTHFAFWIRASALQKLARDFSSRLPAKTQARPRGLVFHLPPQNVETVFLYSWILSYLCGNANVVRLPQDISREMRAICRLFLTGLDAAHDPSQIFAYYPSSSNIGTGISKRSDARVVWGGDAKIAAFAPLPLRNGGKAIWFGDRFSFCVMDGAAIAELGDAERNDLAQRLFNDIFIFDQMACSSPQILYITGTEIAHLAPVNALLETLAHVARARQDAPAAGHQIAKMVQAFSSAAQGRSVAMSWRDDRLTSIVANGPERDERKIGGGFLQVVFIPSLDAVPGLIQAHDQTVTHFGFSAEQIAAVADAHVGFGVSRWAPVGSALDFDFIWDGYDLPLELTRIVRVG